MGTALQELQRKLQEMKNAKSSGENNNSQATKENTNETKAAVSIDRKIESGELGVTSEYQQVIDRIRKLETAIADRVPGYENILSVIHKQLKQDAEITHLLTAEQIGVVFRAMCLRKDVIVTAEVAKKISKKSLSKTTEDDLL